jgi:hypothetical protein
LGPDALTRTDTWTPSLPPQLAVAWPDWPEVAGAVDSTAEGAGFGGSWAGTGVGVDSGVAGGGDCACPPAGIIATATAIAINVLERA